MAEVPRIAFATLGCRLNQVESDELAALATQAGYRVVEAADPAEVYVVNTCTVTARADASDRQAIRRLRRERPGALLVATGCYAETQPGALGAMSELDLVVGNRDKYRLLELIGRGRRPGEAPVRPDEHGVTPAGALRMLAAPEAAAPLGLAPLGRSRAFVKIQDGCQHRCAFCIVPAARGASRSRALEVVVAQVESLVATGHAEVTLTGVDIGHFGWDLQPRTSLAALIRRLADVRGLRWLRLSSVLPAYFTAELIEVVTGAPVVAPHLHVPLQSGSDTVLRMMRRPYNTALYRRVVERLSAGIPDLGLGTDVIVGHPGEGETEFAETMSLVRALPFSYLHVFAYSDRQGTEAARLGARPAAGAVRERSRRLRALGDDQAAAFRRGLLGRAHDALVLDARDPLTGRRTGLTGHFVEVEFDGPAELARRIVRLRLDALEGGRPLGVLEREAA
jgi:threonylcarbamoyladenosine tRNA methylthiotransferase MtaB